MGIRRGVKKHAGGMFLASDLGGYAAVASILVSTAPPRLAHFPVGRAESPAPTNILRGFSVGADNEHSGAKRNKYPWGIRPRLSILPCHSEPVTDVTGVGILIHNAGKETDCRVASLLAMTTEETPLSFRGGRSPTWESVTLIRRLPVAVPTILQRH